MMALDRSPESFSPQMNSTSFFLWFQLVILGVGPVLIPRGIIWIKLTKVYEEMLHTKKSKVYPFKFQRRRILKLVFFVPMFQLVTPLWGQFYSKGIIWTRLIKVHKEMLNNKYQSTNPCSFREEEFWSWFSLFLCSNLWPPGRGQFWPHQHGVAFDQRGIIWPNLVEVYKEMLRPNIKALCLPVQRRRILRMGFFVPMFQLVTPRVGSILTPGASSKQTW